MWKVYASSVDGVHIIETCTSENKAIAEAKKWLGSIFTEVSPICWISQFGDKVYIEEEQEAM